MNFQALLPIAKVLFPNNTRLLEAATQAAEICKRYQGTEGDLHRAIQDLNIQPSIITKAVAVLNSPAFASKLNLVAPGLAGQMQSTVNKMMGTSPQGQTGHSVPSGESNLQSLRDRLSKL